VVNRALLIASQTAGLRGCHADVRLMAEALGEWELDCTTLTDGAATQAGILRAYRGLIDLTLTGDAVVVYYSGHGGRIRNLTATDDPTAAYWQFIVPADFEASAPDEFRGILAEELRALQLELSTKSDNVTTILDCCHAALMSRDPAVVPRFLPRPWTELRPGAIARWEQAVSDLRAALALQGTVPADAESNQRAVRVVACLPAESAFEVPDSKLGTIHGLLTVNLAGLLREARQAPASGAPTWADLAGPLRARVLARVGHQHVLIEGPSDRQLFSTGQADGARGWPVEVVDGEIRLPGAAFIGIGPGDRVALVGGADPGDGPIEATVTRIEAGRAVLALAEAGARLGPTTVAHPLTLSARRRPVVVDAALPAAADVRAAIAASPRLSPADPSEVAPLARVVVDGDGLMLFDHDGLAQYAAPRPVNASELDGLVGVLERFARAAVLRELVSGTGSEALDLPVALTVHADPDGPPLESGDTLSIGSVYVRVHHRGRTHDRPVYVNVIDLGQIGDVSVLSADASPTGIELAPGQTYQLYGSEGAWLSWPDGLPPDEPRPETFMAVFTDGEHDLRAVASGTTRSIGERPADRAAPLRYRVERFEFLLDPGFQLAEPRAGIDRGGSRAAPMSLAVRLLELVVRRPGSTFATDVRLDAVFVTGCPINEGQPFLARTFRLLDATDERLCAQPIDLYDGPVQGELEMAWWVSRAAPDQPDLAELLASSAPEAPVEAAGRVLRRVVGRSVGLYRTTLAVPAGVTPGRHPRSGFFETPDAAFAYEVVSSG
jgi:hypothetical protein